MEKAIKILVPVMSIAILGLCIWASVKQDAHKPIDLENLYQGGIGTYFFAKGLFCSTAIFLLGKLLEQLLRLRDNAKDDAINKSGEF